MISIIIPTLNEEKYLPNLLNSIKDQDFEADLEIIVADAGSEDKTREIAKSFGCKVVEGGMPARGRNQGAKVAKSDVLLFVDADIFLPKDFLNKSLKEFFDRNLDGACFNIYPSKRGVFKKILFNIFYNYPVRIFVRILPLGSMVLLVKKSTHEKIKGFNEQVVFLEDLDYLKRFAKGGKYRIIKAVPVFASIRRFEQKGWIKESLKVLLGNIYMMFFGPIKRDIFKYKFNHYKN